MERSSLTFQTFKNIMYNVIGYVWPMFFALFITPIIIFRLGIKNYGIYIFVNTIISLFGLLDLGLGAAITKHMSFYFGKRDEKAITTLTHSANSLFLIVGSLGLLLSIGIAFFGPRLLPLEFASYEQYSSLFIIGGLIFFTGTIFNTYSTILTAIQRYDVSNIIGMVSILTSSLGMFSVIILGGGVTSILLVQLVVTTLSGLATVYITRKILPPATIHLDWDTQEVRHCYKFGIVTFVNNIASVALASLDRLIIPFYVGPSNLTYYSLPGNVSGKIPGISNTLSATLFPTTSKLDGEDNNAKIEILYVRSFRLITAVAAALTITSIAFGYKILLFWLNADFADHSTGILIILACTNFILALLGPLSNFLLGYGKLKFLTTMSLCMGIFNAILLLVLLPRYGIMGAAWAYLISVLPSFYMFYYTEKKYLRLTERKRYYIRKFYGTLITAGIVWIIDYYVLSPIAKNIWSLLAAGGTSIILYFIIYKIFGFFEDEDWKDMENFFKIVTRKLRITKI